MQTVVGSKWGTLAVLDVNYKEYKVDPWETIDRAECWTLKCQCGKTVEMYARDFKGRSVTRDCGCGSAEGLPRIGRVKPGVDRKFEEPKFMLQCALPADLMRRIRVKAVELNVSISRLVVSALRAAFDE